MAWYPYSYKTAFNPITRELAPAGAAGEIYAIGDTTFSTPLQAYDLAGLPVDLTVQGAVGYVPSFQVEDNASVIWKSGDYIFEFTTTMPLPGPAGESITGVKDNGDGTINFTFDDGTTTQTITLPVGAGGSDSGVAGYINSATTETTAALVAAYATLDAQGRQPVRKGELIINALDYGIVGDGTAQDLTALNTAITDLHPVTVYFPKPSARYEFTQPFPNVDDVRIVGDGQRTLLRWTAGSMLAPTTTLQGWVFESIAIDNLGTASHLIDLGATGGLIHSSFRNTDLHPRVTTTSALHINGTGNLFDVHFHDTLVWRQPTHTVPAIDLHTTSSGVNSMSFTGGWWHSQGCDTSPFFRAENTSGTSYLPGFSFKNIIGEQNAGGMIHMFAANGVEVNNVIDYDQSTYADDLFKFGAGNGLESSGVELDNAGTSGNVSFTNAANVHLRITGGSHHKIGRIVQATRYGKSSTPKIGSILTQGGGMALAVQEVAANFTIRAEDHLVLATGTITVTLPDPGAEFQGGTVPIGREYIVKNTGAGTVTVDVAGTPTVDGSASKSLAAGATLRTITDGANWIVV